MLLAARYDVSSLTSVELLRWDYKEAVRYKLEFDKYIQKKQYSQLNAMVAFSGEVSFSNSDPNSEGLLGEKVKSQLGFACLLTDDGLDWGSLRIKMICRASMGAEAHGLTEGAKALEWIRALYYEMEKPNQPLGDLVDDVAKLIPVKWYDDANSLVTHLHINGLNCILKSTWNRGNESENVSVIILPAL